MTSAQIRMARAAVQWSVRDLAEKSGVHRNTVTRVEAGGSAHGPTLEALQRALEAAGIEFTNGDEPGVKLKKKGKRK
jgi:transcriptional regulator with XRE-family HTH domain